MFQSLRRLVEGGAQSKFCKTCFLQKDPYLFIPGEVGGALWVTVYYGGGDLMVQFWRKSVKRFGLNENRISYKFFNIFYEKNVTGDDVLIIN